MAQAVTNPTIAGGCRKHPRVQEQPLLIDGKLEVRRGWLRMVVTGAAFAAAFHLLFIYLLSWLGSSAYGAATSFSFGFT
jgi:hypothetical protein